MYIVAICWAYVALMIAATSASLIMGLDILVGLGAVPPLVFTYIDGPRGRQRRARKMADPQNAADAHSDQ